MSIYTIIVAAGQGKRFGGAKQFYLVNGRPLLYYTTEHFEKNNDISSIILTVPKNTINTVKKCLQEWSLHKVQHVIAGGKRRQDSVYNALRKIRSRKGIVIIHDGARPIISQRVIKRGIQLCKRHAAVISGLPISDTIKYIHKNRVKRTVPRDHLYAIQTPQFFNLTTLKDAYAYVDLDQEYTDDAAIVEAFGVSVHIFKGDEDNIKVTHRSDIRRVIRILPCRK